MAGRAYLVRRGQWLVSIAVMCETWKQKKKSIIKCRTKANKTREGIKRRKWRDNSISVKSNNLSRTQSVQSRLMSQLWRSAAAVGAR